MKKALLISVTVVACLTTALSVQVEDNSTKENVESINLENISLMQANAFETWCDSKDPDECKIGESKATGYLRVEY